jgi:hypothetical protein
MAGAGFKAMFCKPALVLVLQGIVGGNVGHAQCSGQMLLACNHEHIAMIGVPSLRHVR